MVCPDVREIGANESMYVSERSVLSLQSSQCVGAKR